MSYDDACYDDACCGDEDFEIECMECDAEVMLSECEDGSRDGRVKCPECGEDIRLDSQWDADDQAQRRAEQGYMDA